jgi:sialic acid synthase SpsE
MALMRIGNSIIGEGRRTLMFAEEGQANQGNIDVAISMCKTAAVVGADGIEFQFFLADDMYVRNDLGYATYKSREISPTQIRELIAVAHAEGLLCQIAGFSPKIIELCAEAGADVFCVNATDLNNPAIIDAVAGTGKPFWLATLMGNIEEIDWAVDYVLSHSKSEVGLMHGQHVMSSDTTRGVPPELLQLDCIELLKRRYGLVVGFVDHTATQFVPSIAAAKGAAVVMKHLAPQKNWQGPDWVVCLDPASWKDAKTMLEYTVKANGASKEISQAEFKDRSLHRRSIYTRIALPAGHQIVADDLVALRPGKGGVDPRTIHDLVGLHVAHNLPEQHQLLFDDLVRPN